MEIFESQCTFTHEDRSFTAMGAVLTPWHCYAYLSEEGPRARSGKATTWHGQTIGRWYEVSSWPVYTRWDRYMMQHVHVVLDDGRIYSGRRNRDWSQLVKIKRLGAPPRPTQPAGAPHLWENAQ